MIWKVKKVEIYIDGCCLGNRFKNCNRTGSAAIVVFNDYGHLVYENGVVIEDNQCLTNNICEYLGLMLAFDFIEENGLFNEDITIFSDSQLMVYQVNGIYSCDSKNLLPFYNEAVKFLEGRENIKLEWIPREQNTLADELSKEIVCEK